MENEYDDDFVDEPRKPTKRGFAKIDVVDVILSEENTKPDSSTDSCPKGNATPDLLKGLYAPTYRLEPKKKFDPDAVTNIIKEHLERELREMTYGERECINACKRVSYNLRKAVKILCYDRYRFICQVRIVEKNSQGIETKLGFLWDPNFDAYAFYSMETHTFAASATIFGVYKE